MCLLNVQGAFRFPWPLWKRPWRSVLASALGVLCLAAADSSLAIDPSPSPDARCPVCGMFVTKHPGWAASVTFRDGTVLYFDGPKDMFKFLFDPSRFSPGRTGDDIAGAFVTDYYTLQHIDARNAVFVIGSDVMGPMGRELVPLGGEAAAAAFMNDHNGEQTHSFDSIMKTKLLPAE